MIKIYLTILFSILLSNLDAQITLDKPFAVANEFISIIYTEDGLSEECIAYLILKGNDGGEKFQMPAKMQDGVAIFKFEIPSSFQEGWYHAYAFTKDANSDRFAKLSYKSFPIYALDSQPKKPKSLTSNTEQLGICTKADISATQNLRILRTNDLHKLESQMQIAATNLSNSDISSRAKKLELTIELNVADLSKTFVAFYNSDLQKIQGLRKLEGRNYSLEVEHLDSQLNGQFVGITAFGELSFLPFKILRNQYQLPDLEAITAPLPAYNAITQYIVRHNKRLKVMALYDQSYVQKEKISSERKVDIKYLTKDYIQFNNTTEFIAEVLQVVRYNERKDQFSVLSEDKNFSKEQPLLILNGQIVMKSRDLLGIDYKDIESIEVQRTKVNLRSNFSTFGRNGVILVEAKESSNKYLSSLFSWNDFNKINVSFDSKSGPDFTEAKTLLNSQTISNDFSNETNLTSFRKISNKWESKTCKINTEM